MIITSKRFIIGSFFALDSINLFAVPSDYGRPSDYGEGGSHILSLDSTFGFIVFLIVGVICAIIFFASGNSERKDDTSKGCGIIVLILILLGIVIKCSS